MNIRYALLMLALVTFPALAVGFFLAAAFSENGRDGRD